MRRAWKENHQRMSNAIRAGLARPEAKKRQTEAARALAARPEEKQRRRELMKGKWADPRFRKRTIKAIRLSRTPDVRKRIGEASKRLWERRNALLRAAEQKLADSAEQQSGPTGKHLDEKDKQYFIIGKKVQDLIDAGTKLVDARHSIAETTQLSYASVVKYHKTYLRRLARN